jgi:acetyl esterase
VERSPPLSRAAGIPPAIEQRIRALGPVLDMASSRAIYEPLLESQARSGVRVVENLAYGPDARHRLDVYCPDPPTASPAPILVVFPGGGFIRGDKSERSNAGLLFARAGLVTIVANYRLGPAHRWPSGAEDVIRTLQWIREHGSQYGADRNRICLLGESAGATHVASAVLLRRFQPTDGLGIAGAVLISGVYNLELERKARRQFGIATPDPRNEAYFGSDFQRYPDMSIVDHIDAPALPLLVTYAELDLVQMQVQAGDLFARLVTRHGFSPDLRVIRGHNHLTQVFSLNTGDESLSRPVLQFLHALGMSSNTAAHARVDGGS